MLERNLKENLTLLLYQPELSPVNFEGDGFEPSAQSFSSK